MPQEAQAPGSARRRQEIPGGPRRSQEAPGGPRNPQETSRGSRRPQEASGGPSRPQEAPRRAKNVRRALAGAQFSENMCAALMRGRHFALSRGMCAASHSFHAFCDVGDKTSMLRRKSLISYCFFTGSSGTPRMEPLSDGMQWVHRYILIRNEDRGRHFALSRRSVRRVPFLPHILRRGRQNVHVDRKNVDFVLFFHR